MTDQQPNHPISLEKVFFTKCVVIAVPDHKPVNGLVTKAPDNNIDVKKVEGNAGEYVASMRTVLNQAADKSNPYIIDIECIGLFLADDTLTEQEAFRAITITAHNVLYGAIRETIAWLTSRQAYGPLLLGLSVLKSNKPAEVEKAQVPAK